MPTPTRAISKTVLDRETDARFWAQTGYKVGQKLDPKDVNDRIMMPVWLDIYGKVKREDKAGALVLTYNHPDVEDRLDDAALAGHAAAAHLDAAIDELDPDWARHHVNAAADAAAKASRATHGAASRQPPTVSPIIVEAAAQQSARAAAAPPPAPVVTNLPATHPAAASNAARPVLPPEIVNSQSPPVRPPLVRLPIPGMPGMRPRPGQHLATAQAVTAPGVAVAVHERASARDARGAPPIGTLHPQAMSDIRKVAVALAQGANGQFIGINYDPAGEWAIPRFSSRGEATTWYGHLTDTPDMFRYVAFFDKGDPGWPSPIDEVFGSSQALGDASRAPPRGVPTRPSSPSPASAPTATSSTSYGSIATIGAVAVAGILTIFAAAQKRRSASRSFPGRSFP